MSETERVDPCPKVGWNRAYGGLFKSSSVAGALLVSRKPWLGVSIKMLGVMNHHIFTDDTHALHYSYLCSVRPIAYIA